MARLSRPVSPVTAPRHYARETAAGSRTRTKVVLLRASLPLSPGPFGWRQAIQRDGEDPTDMGLSSTPEGRSSRQV